MDIYIYILDMHLESIVDNKNVTDNDGDLFVPREVKFGTVDSNDEQKEHFEKMPECLL